MRHTQKTPDSRPVVLWTCDVKGWAYYNRIKRLQKVMSDRYEFRIWYFGGILNREARDRYLSEADIIVCQGVKSLRIVQLKRLEFRPGADPQAVIDARYSNVVGRLDSIRIDNNGEYIDIFAKQETADPVDS